MATSLTKPLSRKLEREQLIVRITPEGIYTREPKKRTWWGPVAWSKVHRTCQMVQVNEAIETKRRRRKVGRGLLKVGV